MFKKISLVLLMIIFVSAGIFVFFELRQKPVINNNLSKRSQEFIEGKKFASNSQWSNLNLDGSEREDTRGKRIGRDNCYSFVMLYRVTIAKYEDQSGNVCTSRFTFENPSGAILAYKYVKPVSSWDDIPAVSQRRRQTEEYFPEEQKILNGKNFIMFRTKNDIYEKNVFYYTDSYFFVFNFLTKTNENLDKDLDTMLATLEIK